MATTPSRVKPDKPQNVPFPLSHGAWHDHPTEIAREALPFQILATKEPPVSEDLALAFVYVSILSYATMVVARVFRLPHPARLARKEAEMIGVGIFIFGVLCAFIKQ